MALVLTSNDIHAVFSMQDCMAVVEEAFRRGFKDSWMPTPRPTLRLRELDAVVFFMPAYSRGSRRISLKIVSEYKKNPERFGLRKQGGELILHDAETGSLLAVMSATTVTALRTGAMAGIATKHLSRKESTRVGVIGSGVEAQSLLLATVISRPIAEVRIYSPNIGRRKKYAAEMRSSLRINVEAVDSPAKAVEGADIIIAATNSATPVFDGKGFDDGVHINSIGTLPDKRELDSKTIARCAAKIVADTVTGVLAEAGDIIQAINGGVLPKERPLYADLGEIVRGEKKGRTSPLENTLFKSVGFGYLDLVCGSRIHELAIERGVGLKIPSLVDPIR